MNAKWTGIHIPYEWIKKKCIYTHLSIQRCVYIYTYMYTENINSHKKKNEILPFAATWMDLDDIILSERKSEKDKY